RIPHQAGGFRETEAGHHGSASRCDAEGRMTAPPDDTTTDLHAVIAALRAERDAALAREAELAEALARRNTEFGERIEQQSATIDVLKAMSASPGDARPVFELI